MAEQVLTFIGRNRAGHYVSGSTTADPAEFVGAKFKARWQALTLCCPEFIVGAIDRHPDTGRRLWWAESCPGHDDGSDQ